MKNMINIPVIYGAIAIITWLLTIIYWKRIAKKEKWLSCFYITILVINTGYFAISLLNALQGDIFLNWLIYKHQYLAFHIVIAMLSIILYVMKKWKSLPYIVTVFYMVIVLGNMAVWFIEQLLHMEFEFLTVFYIFTGGVLFVFSIMLEDIVLEKQEEQKPQATCDETELAYEETYVIETSDDHIDSEMVLEKAKILEDSRKKDVYELIKQKMNQPLLDGLENLSVREMEVLLLILENKKRKCIAEEMEITENTVKKHTTHIYSKLGVSSRKELFAKCEKMSFDTI